VRDRELAKTGDRDVLTARQCRRDGCQERVHGLGGVAADRLAKALREYGRLVRTNFILAWAGDPGLRARGSASSTRAKAPTRCTATSASATAAASTLATPSSRNATWTPGA
jgi:Tn3 transposase DDE domain